MYIACAKCFCGRSKTYSYMHLFICLSVSTYQSFLLFTAKQYGQRGKSVKTNCSNSLASTDKLYIFKNILTMADSSELMSLINIG